MKRSFVLTFFVLGICASSAISAKDFRALDFGERCDNLRSLEEAKGSSFHSATPEMGVYLFKGTHLGLPVEIGYTCVDSQFQRGTYIFMLSQRHATDLYARIKDMTTYEFGQPAYDFNSQQHRERLHALGVRQSGENDYSCIWEDKRRRIQLLSYGPRSGQEWKTALSYELPEEAQQAN